MGMEYHGCGEEYNLEKVKGDIDIILGVGKNIKLLETFKQFCSN